MPVLPSSQFPPPSSWDEMETLIWDLLRQEWKDPGTQKNGRIGQPQHGVDIWGRPDKGTKWAGAQVKNPTRPFESQIREKELLDEVEKAKKFEPPLSTYIFVTSGASDAKVQKLARKITKTHLKNRLFSVDVWGWDEVQRRLAGHSDLVRLYYPQYFQTDDLPLVEVESRTVQRPNKVILEVRNKGAKAFQFQARMLNIAVKHKQSHRIPYAIRWEECGCRKTDGWMKISPGASSNLEVATSVSRDSKKRETMIRFCRSDKDDTKFNFPVDWGFFIMCEIEVFSELALRIPMRYSFRIVADENGQLTDFSLVE